MHVAEITRPAVPVEYGLLIRDVVARRGVAPEVLFASAGVPGEIIDDPDGRLTGLQAGALLHVARELTHEPGLGYEIGLSSNLTSHGMVGFGLLSCANVAQAIALGERYLPLRLPMIAMALTSDGATAAIEVTETVPTGAVQQCLLDLFLVGLSRMAPALTNHRSRPEDVELWFDQEEPDYYARYADRLPPSRFGMGTNQIRFPASDLSLGPATANAVTVSIVEARCRRELEQIGFHQDLVVQVRAALRQQLGRPSDLETIAAQLMMSGRTLRRRLAEEGTSFRRQVESVRRQEAIRLLENTGLSVAQIAERVGYTDVSSFSRAFVKWTSTTPGAYRP